MKQLKAADLRLGNYVWNDVQDLPVRVDMRILSEQQLRERLLKVGTLKEGVLWKPLKITPEILEKMGFKTRTTETHSVQYFIGINPITKDWLFDILWLDGDEFPFYRNGYFKLKFVHQLQNLYQALTQEELEFEL